MVSLEGDSGQLKPGLLGDPNPLCKRIHLIIELVAERSLCTLLGFVLKFTSQYPIG